VIYKNWTAMLLTASIAMVAVVGCGDEGSSTATSSSSGSGGSGGGSGGAGGGSGGAGGGTGGNGGSGGGMVVDPGKPGTALVSAGHVVSNAGYKMVFTLGQSSGVQTNVSSPNYSLKGGLIGATQGN
jgi:hypothetical protein